MYTIILSVLKKALQYLGIPFYTVTGGSDQDDEYSFLGHAFSFDEASRMALAFVALRPMWHEAEIWKDNKVVHRVAAVM